MDERRDLVDREELRRQINADANGRDDTPWRSGWCSGQFHAIELLDAMPAVECPRGWTRDEVLAELDADPDAVCEFLHPLSAEWGTVHPDDVRSWWHPEVRRYDVRVVRVAPEPEWVPLTRLVGRTIHGCEQAVADWWREDGEYVWTERTRPGPIPQRLFPEGTLNLETGQVAVRPKAAT